MSVSQEVFKEVDFLSRLLTSNPYTAEGKSILDGLDINLTTDQFFEEKLYAEPFFVENPSPITAHVNPIEDADEDDATDKEDYIFVSDDNTHFRNIMKKNFENFKTSFNNLHELPLLFIRGGSGTGKSTFMYRLIHELTKSNSNILHTELTLEEYSEKQYYGITLPVTSDDTISRFIRIVFSKIFSIVESEINQSIKTKNFERIINAFYCYIDNFIECPSENQKSTAFFEAFCDLDNQKRNNMEYKQKIIKACINHISSNASNMDTLCNLLLLLIELRFCLDSNKFNLISFDGIEYLINRTHYIYDSDINDIILAFEKAKQSAENLFKECNLKFADKFKIVLSIRNTTLSYCNKRVQENIRDSATSVDVTDWYRIEDIYEAKVNYFTKHNFICESDLNKISDIVNVIIKDSKKGKERASGAMDMLERMYNFDKRSLQSNLLTAVSQIVLNSDGGILKDKFIELYNNKGPMVYNTDAIGRRFRYLCRRAIIRILLNHIEIESRDTFFDGIYFSEYGNECKQSSYMRKLLIFLIHNQVVDNKITDNYVPFDKVINAIARPSSNSNIESSTIEQIAILIYRLSDFRLHDSAWQQLISLKFNYGDKSIFSDEKRFVSEVKKLFYEKKLAKDEFGIKLNYAGAFLAYIQSDFEFFACRCKGFQTPLIFTNDVNYIKSLLEAVYSKSVACIKMVIDDEKTMFGDYRGMYTSNKKYLYKDTASHGRLLSHPKRIINNHITYLEHYRCFVKEVEGVFNSDDDKSIILEKIEEIIEKYITNYNDLVDGYGTGDFAGLWFLKDYNEVPYLWRSNKL